MNAVVLLFKKSQFEVADMLTMSGMPTVLLLTLMLKINNLLYPYGGEGVLFDEVIFFISRVNFPGLLAETLSRTLIPNKFIGMALDVAKVILISDSCSGTKMDCI